METFSSGVKFNDAVLAAPEKQAIYAKFDKDVIEYYKKYGRGYQARMNAVLRAYMEAHPLSRNKLDLI